MKIGIDIGNTNLKIGYIEDNEVKVNKIRIDEDIINQLDNELKDLEYQRVAYLSVVPQLDKVMKQYFNDQIMEEVTTFTLDYSLYSDELGLDRKVGMEAVHELHNLDNFIFIDCGSATTINIVVNKQFQGGVIMPGMGLQYSALNQFTTLNINYERNNEEKLYGLNTSDNVMSGIYNSIIYSLKGFVKDINKEFNMDLPIIVTGGNARYFCHELPKDWNYYPNLTLTYLLNNN